MSALGWALAACCAPVVGLVLGIAVREGWEWLGSLREDRRNARRLEREVREYIKAKERV